MYLGCLLYNRIEPKGRLQTDPCRQKPPRPNFKVVLRICAGKASKKTAICVSAACNTQTTLRKGGRGRIDNGATYYVGWLFFLKNPGRVSKKIARQANFWFGCFTVMQLPCDVAFLEPLQNQFALWRRGPVLRTLFWWVLGLVILGFAIKLFEIAL